MTSKRVFRMLGVEDFAKFVMVAEPRVSPSVSRIAFVTIKPDLESDRYMTGIWVTDLDGRVIAVTQGLGDASPRWSPNGEWIAFTSRRTLKEGEEGVEIWVMRPAAGEPKLIHKAKFGLASLAWSADSRHLIFTSPRRLGEEEDDDYRVVKRIPVWFNGRGFIYNRRSFLHILDVQTGNVEVLEEWEMEVLYVAPSNRGDRLALVAYTDELNPRIRDIYLYDVASGELEKITEKSMFIGPLTWSPDDEMIAFIGHDLRRGFSTHENVWVIDVCDGKAVDVTRSMNKNDTNRLYCDLRGPYRVEQYPVWDENYVYFQVSDGGSLKVYRTLRGNWSLEPVIDENCAVESFDVKHGLIAYVRMTSSELPELWVTRSGVKRKLTSFNEWLSAYTIVKPRKFSFRASDGVVVDGWIMKPPCLKSGEKVPGILFIHGGPKAAYGEGFMFEYQLFAAKGYAIIYTNPRGSDGYSEEFADIRGAYGSRDYRDIMEAVDYVLENFDFVDGERLGVTGISYGGFMTNWIVTHTDRFKAAVTQNGICSWDAEYGTTDIGFYFVEDQLGGTPWRNWEKLRRQSPLTYVENVKTPLMILHSMEDYRCWIDQALLMYTALKTLEREVELVLFNSGEHGFSRTAKPSIRAKRYRLMLKWFDNFLRGGDAQ